MARARSKEEKQADRVIVVDQGEVVFRTSKKRFALAYCDGRGSPTAEIFQRVTCREWAEIRSELAAKLEANLLP